MRSGIYRGMILITCVLYLVLGRALYRGTDTECYCVFCKSLSNGIYRGTNIEYLCALFGSMEGNIEMN